MADQAAQRHLIGRNRRKKLPYWQESPVLVLIAIVFALLIKTFLIQPFYIPSGSMQNTFQLRDRVLVDKVSYDFRAPRRGEIMVFTGAEWGPEPHYIKRVIGLPGDTVRCCDPRGRVMIDGSPLAEPYIFENTSEGERSFGPVKVPAGRLWVMGDHRSGSGDSRAHVGDQWHGTIPIDRVIGHAFAIAWSPGRADRLSVPESLESSRA